jgi:saccharopine dehydrogenase-like NADP-dependent oxidoreductase
MQRVLIIGGCGRIGSSIASDILAHVPTAEVTITSRNPQLGMAALERLGAHVQFQVLDLSQPGQLQDAVAKADLVVHAAGPFHRRDGVVLRTCIGEGVHYIDVSDERSFTRNALTYREAAAAAGITAIINTGVFPGISNCMVRQGIEALDEADAVQLSYVVAGSGGAGVAVMRTTFIGLQRPFEAWLDGSWQPVKPYTQRETLEFPQPYGKAGVYWYDMPEATTLQQSFPLKTVITKFGVVPDFYNHATWTMAHWLPPVVLRQAKTVEFLAQVSYAMTRITNRFSGTGVAMRCDISGQRSQEPVHYTSTFVHDDAAIATGIGTGSVVELMLKGKLQQPGVSPIEQVLPTAAFEAMMSDRQIQIHQAVQSERSDRPSA